MVSDSMATGELEPRRPVRKARRIPRDAVPCFIQLSDGKQEGGDWPSAPGLLAPSPSPAPTTAVAQQSGEGRKGVGLRQSWDASGDSSVTQAVLHSYPPSASLPYGAPYHAHPYSVPGAAGPSAFSVGRFRQPLGAPGSWHPSMHPGGRGFAERICPPGTQDGLAQGQCGPAAGLGYLPGTQEGSGLANNNSRAWAEISSSCSFLTLLSSFRSSASVPTPLCPVSTSTACRA